MKKLFSLKYILPLIAILFFVKKSNKTTTDSSVEEAKNTPEKNTNVSKEEAIQSINEEISASSYTAKSSPLKSEKIKSNSSTIKIPIGSFIKDANFVQNSDLKIKIDSKKIPKRKPKLVKPFNPNKP